MISMDYDIAQVCLNGHIANDAAVRQPEDSQDFCELCGERTIVCCTGCKEPIRGAWRDGYDSGRLYTPPCFCRKCGKPFPWTDRRIQAAIDLAAESGNLDADEQKQFSESVNEIAKDSPKATLAGTRIARMIGKMGQATGNAVRDILVDVASEAVKKTIWPGK